MIFVHYKNNMFPNFTSLSQREQKRQALLSSISRELEVDNVKRQAYSEAMWSDDVAKNKINLTPGATTAGTQTDGSSTTTSSSSTSTGTSSNGPSNTGGPSPSVFSGTDGQPGATDESDTNVDWRDLLDGSTDMEGDQNMGATDSRSRAGTNSSIASIDDGQSEYESMDEGIGAQEALHIIRGLFERNPELVLQELNPISLKDGRPNKQVFLGKDGDLFNKGNRSRVDRDDVLQMIDWEKTLKFVIAKDNKVQAILMAMRKLKSMKSAYDDHTLKDKAFGKFYDNYVEAVIEADERARQEEDSNYEDVSGVVENLVLKTEEQSRNHMSEHDAKATLSTLLTNNRQLAERYEVIAIKNDGVPVGNGYKFDPVKMTITTKSGKETARAITMTENISWMKTLTAWVNKLRTAKKGLDVDVRGTAITITNTTNKRGLGDSTSSFKPELQRGRTTTNANDGYRARIKYLFTTLPQLKDEQIHPVVNRGNGGEFDQRYIWGPRGEILIRHTRTSPPEAELDNVRKHIVWGRSYFIIKQHIHQNVLHYMIDRKDFDEVRASIQRALKHADAMDLVMNDNMDRVDQFAARHNNRLGLGFSKVQLKGRGLMGAGVSPEGHRKTTSYTSKNLKTIEGTGTASDLKYKRVGSKFIRIADLRNNKLKLVYPNRTSVGRLRDIHADLAKLIHKLVFEKDIDQQLYGQLSIDDKKLFCEILKSTHLQHQFSNTLEDPLEALKAEFDKLRGELALGNDNPDLIRELKALTVDLYSQKLISEKEFRDIVVNL